MPKPRSRTAIVDYGAGNMLSVIRALRHVGAEVETVETPEAIAAADRLVLPGVGAFGKAMQQLTAKALTDAVRNFAESGRPLLGICLGMQMLLDASEEFGRHEGLGIIPGQVCAVPPRGSSGQKHKIPHTGWAHLRPPQAGRWRGTLLDGLSDDLHMYFVHSFHAVPRAAAHVLAVVDYDGVPVTAAIHDRNVSGFQCHPEKSGSNGLAILDRFLLL